MTTPRAIPKRMKQTRRDTPASVAIVVSDNHNFHCVTQADLDAWWASLDPTEKADVYEQHLEAQVLAEDSPQAAASSAFTDAAIMKNFGEQAQRLLDSYPREFLTLPKKSLSVQPEKRRTL